MKNKHLRYNEAAENMIGRYYRVLDKGHVGLVSYHGTDAMVEAAARISYQQGTRTVNDTRNLLRYMMRHHHTSPFEQCSLTFHLKLPLYVAQQLLRHRTAKLNQESHRYSEAKDEFHQLKAGEWRAQSGANKQGSDGYIDGDFEFSQNVLLSQAYEEYKARIDAGVAREIARKDLPSSTYTNIQWQCDLSNLMKLLNLRSDSHAQLEIREYSNIMGAIAKQCFPICLDAWIDYVFGAVTFSRQEMLCWDEQSGIVNMSSRELKEFREKKALINKHRDLDSAFNIHLYNEKMLPE